MNIDRNIIGKKVSLLYEEMEYQSDYNTDQFLNDFKTEMMKKLEIPDNDKLWEVDEKFRWIQALKKSFDKHRSILTKLFSLTNNSNGVDTLIEYCDYYSSYYSNSSLDVSDCLMSELTLHLFSVFDDTFIRMAKRGTTNKVLIDIWRMLEENIGWSTTDFGRRHIQATFIDKKHCSTLAMVIMADSDLNAAVQTFIASYNTSYRVTKVLVQEPIREQLLDTIRNEEFKDKILSNLFVFRNTEEALGNLNGKDKVEALSIWSENIIAAKQFSANAQTHTIWINALGLLDFGLHSIHDFSELFRSEIWDNYSSDPYHELSKTDIKTAKKYDHFYGGKWQIPVDGKYWTHETGDSIAEATLKDFENCANAAREAFKVWRSTKLSQRVKVITCFAERLRAMGEPECADIVLKLLHRPLDFGTSLSIVRDGEAAILTTPEPVGVIAIRSNSQSTIFLQLAIASVTGNAVTVALDQRSYMLFAPYCDLLGTCGFPPGLISCIFTTNHFLANTNDYVSKYFDRILKHPLGNLNRGILDPYKHRTTEDTPYNHTFIRVTRPKSVWIPLH